MSRTPRPGGDLVAVAELCRLVRRFRPDVVHTHTAKAGTLGRLAVLLARGPGRRRRPRVFHTFHGHSMTGYFSPLASALARLVEATLARLVTARVVALSPLQQAEIARLLRLDPTRIVVLPNGLDLSAFASLPRRGAFRRELGISADAFVWGAVGRLAPVKRYDLLFAVAHRLREREEKAPTIVVIGGGEGLEAFRQRVRAEGLVGRLTFCGPRLDLPQIYADLDGAVLCSRQEGTPLSLIEAIVCGLPIVATAVGGVPDLLQRSFEGPLERRVYRQLEPARGVLVAAGDVAALAEQLALRPPRGSAVAAGSPFGLPRMLDDLEALYASD